MANDARRGAWHWGTPEEARVPILPQPTGRGTTAMAHHPAFWARSRLRFFQPRRRPRRAGVALLTNLVAAGHSDDPGAVAGCQGWHGERTQKEEAGRVGTMPSRSATVWHLPAECCCIRRLWGCRSGVTRGGGLQRPCSLQPAGGLGRRGRLLDQPGRGLPQRRCGLPGHQPAWTTRAGPGPALRWRGAAPPPGGSPVRRSTRPADAQPPADGFWVVLGLDRASSAR